LALRAGSAPAFAPGGLSLLAAVLGSRYGVQTGCWGAAVPLYWRGPALRWRSWDSGSLPHGFTFRDSKRGKIEAWKWHLANWNQSIGGPQLAVAFLVLEALLIWLPS